MMRDSELKELIRLASGEGIGLDSVLCGRDDRPIVEVVVLDNVPRLGPMTQSEEALMAEFKEAIQEAIDSR